MSEGKAINELQREAVKLRGALKDIEQRTTTLDNPDPFPAVHPQDAMENGISELIEDHGAEAIIESLRAKVHALDGEIAWVWNRAREALGRND